MPEYIRIIVMIADTERQSRDQAHNTAIVMHDDCRSNNTNAMLYTEKLNNTVTVVSLVMDI